MLKAFFNGEACIHISSDGEKIKVDTNPQSEDHAFVASPDGRSLRVVDLSGSLTVEGELNKLAANIAIGRDWAGVHYYSDYFESLLMGEEIAAGILQEQTLTHTQTEQLIYKFNSFQGKPIEVKNGEIFKDGNIVGTGIIREPIGEENENE
jgi:hypothetical protein